MINKLLCFLIGLIGCLTPAPLWAYNFLYIHPSSGEPLRWDTSEPIQYYLDPGSLGRLTNEQLHTLLGEAMMLWENASPDANPPEFEFAGYLPEDVNGTNYEKYVSLSTCYSDDLESCPTEAQQNLQTVIIFDEDGTILSNELCRITACSASSGAKVFSGSTGDPQGIAQGIFVLGPSYGSAAEKVSAVVGVMVHELGHLLGLAHSSANQEYFIEGTPDNPNLYMPTMFFAVLPTSDPFEDQQGVSLAPDDIAGISVLYPSDSFSTETVTIKGQILKSDGSPVMHANVIARNIDDPLCEAFSMLSARECEYSSQEICEDAGFTEANYEITGLPPGTYTLEVEEVADESLAMTLAPGLVDPFIYGDSEFWNEGDAAGDSSNLTSSTITLAAGETRENVDIILNRSEVTDDRVKYIPLDTFTPGPGTRCPEEPPIDYAEMIGIDEGEDTTDDGGSTPVSGGCSMVRQM